MTERDVKLEARRQRERLREMRGRWRDYQGDCKTPDCGNEALAEDGLCFACEDLINVETDR